MNIRIYADMCDIVQPFRQSCGDTANVLAFIKMTKAFGELRAVSYCPLLRGEFAHGHLPIHIESETGKPPA